MQLELLTPGKTIFSGEVQLVKLPGSSGSFEVMKNHAPIISALDDGELKVKTEAGETLHYMTQGGVIEVKNNNIVVLVETIEKG